MKKLIEDLKRHISEASKFANDFIKGEKLMVVEKGAYLEASKADANSPGSVSVETIKRPLKQGEIIVFVGMKKGATTGRNNPAEHFKTKDGFVGNFKPSSGSVYAKEGYLQPMDRM